MNRTTIHKSILVTLAAVLFVFASCQKEAEEVHSIPIIKYSYWIYDSVEGIGDVQSYAVNRLLEINYDTNVDKCYMAQENTNPIIMDTFDRSPNWKRGYVNRRDLMHRIIFNGDTITIHHNVNNQIGQSGFRYTHGVLQ